MIACEIIFMYWHKCNYNFYLTTIIFVTYIVFVLQCKTACSTIVAVAAILSEMLLLLLECFATFGMFEWWKLWYIAIKKFGEKPKHCLYYMSNLL